jgi:hypothetical protein
MYGQAGEVRHGVDEMKVVLKTNDVVLLSFAQSLLKDAQIEALVFDGNASVMDGSLGILPRRLMVDDEDFSQAQRILRDGLSAPAPEDA